MLYTNLEDVKMIMSCEGVCGVLSVTYTDNTPIPITDVIDKLLTQTDFDSKTIAAVSIDLLYEQLGVQHKLLLVRLTCDLIEHIVNHKYEEDTLLRQGIAAIKERCDAPQPPLKYADIRSSIGQDDKEALRSKLCQSIKDVLHAIDVGRDEHISTKNMFDATWFNCIQYMEDFFPGSNDFILKRFRQLVSEAE